jgi:hypothetical protein
MAMEGFERKDGTMNDVIVFLFILPLILPCGHAGTPIQGPIRELGRCHFGVAYNVFVEGGIAYVTGNRGVQIIDVRNPSEPRPISHIKIDDGAFGIFVEQNIAYIAGQKDGLFIADVSDPGAPGIIGVYSEKKGMYHEDIVVRKDHGFVSLRDGRLIVLDISDKREPQRIGELKAGADGRGLGIRQDILYFASGFSGLEVIDVDDPASPQKIGTVPGTQGASSIEIHEQILFLGCGGQGVKILDISNPGVPKGIGAFNDGGESNSVFYKDSYLFVADQNDRCIEILDVGDPTQPNKLAENGNDRYIPHDIFFDGRYIYTADAKNGLVILEYDPNARQR